MNDSHSIDLALPFKSLPPIGAVKLDGSYGARLRLNHDRNADDMFSVEFLIQDALRKLTMERRFWDWSGDLSRRALQFMAMWEAYTGEYDERFDRLLNAVIEQIAPEGIGTHAPGTMAIRLPAGALRFITDAGIDNNWDTQGVRGSVIFAVRVDGKEAFRSGIVRGSKEPVRISVDLRNAKVLELVVEDAGDGYTHDQADWCDARIEFDDGTVVHLSDYIRHGGTGDPRKDASLRAEGAFGAFWLGPVALCIAKRFSPKTPPMCVKIPAVDEPIQLPQVEYAPQQFELPNARFAVQGVDGECYVLSPLAEALIAGDGPLACIIGVFALTGR